MISSVLMKRLRKRKIEMNDEKLNELAMTIILSAGDGRALLNEALQLLEEDGNIEEVQEKIKKAKDKIVEAHRLQTDVMQNTIYEKDFNR